MMTLWKVLGGAPCPDGRSQPGAHEFLRNGEVLHYTCSVLLWVGVGPGPGRAGPRPRRFYTAAAARVAGSRPIPAPPKH